ncbi:MAG: NAD-dependent epimerase/dehydratase family protein [Aquirufa sp.]
MEIPQKQLIITGVTGMVGEGVMHEALQSPFVSQVLVINRKPCGVSHPKLKEYLLPDFLQPEEIREVVKGYDVCLFCLGVSSVGMNADEYKQKTYDLTLGFAKVLQAENPNMSFSYISGAGTDSTEQGRLAWARVKGKTENDLSKLGFGDYYSFRPAMIQPTPGLKNALKFYKYINWMFPILKLVAPNSACTLRELGEAMLEAAIFGSPNKTIEGRDILALAKQMRARL